MRLKLNWDASSVTEQTTLLRIVLHISDAPFAAGRDIQQNIVTKKKAVTEAEFNATISKGNQVASHKNERKEMNLPFTAEECKQILSMLKNKTTSANHVSNCPTHDELSGKAFSLISNGNRSAWILDSGCTDHMISDQNLFTYSRPVIGRTVELLNGSITQVTHIGRVHLSSDLILDNVLCVPYFRLNLISISKLASDSSCITIFLSQFCVIQDLRSGKMIGTGIEREGLYFLDQAKKGTCNHAQNLHPNL
jgi:hypothetical protein